MARFLIVASNVSAGDAVGNDIRHLQKILLEDGHEVKLAARTNETANAEVVPLAECLGKTDKDQILIYHQSIDLPEAVALFLEHRGPRVLRYHNITPPELLRQYSEEIARGCARGREETLALLAAKPEAVWADSPYNAEELQGSGVSPEICHIIPPAHVIDELHQVAPDATLAAKNGDGRKNILTVGRIVPNKCPHRLIEAIGVLKAQGRIMPRLIIVGRTLKQFAAYTDSLVELAKKLQVQDDVCFHFGVSPGELRALYEKSHLFAIASDHEGFCVPLVEAMSFGVPIVALAAAAVSGTLGNAGITWPHTDARVWAATFARILRDDALATELKVRGRKRYEENFTTEKISAAYRGAIKQLLDLPSKVN